MPNYPYTVTSIWGADRTDPGLEGGLNALAKGVTSSHIATTLYTNDKSSYDRAIKAGIPCETFVDNSNVTVYQIHFSYGPSRSNPLNPGSKLDESYLINCLNAQLLTPTASMSLIDQQKNTVYSPLDVAHTNPTGLLLSPLSLVKIDTPEEGQIVQKFQIKLNLLLQEYLDPNNPEKNTDAGRQKYFSAVKNEVSELKKKLDPSDMLTMDQFVYDFNSTKGTIGLRPRETIETRLLTKQQADSGMHGFVEDALVVKMLEFKKKIDADEKEYNFVLDNCSHAVRDLFIAATNDADIKDLMQHTIGYNDFKKFGFLSDKTLLAAVEIVAARNLETPVNVAINLIAVNEILNKFAFEQKDPNPGKTLASTDTLKRIRPRELDQRLPSRQHHKNGIAPQLSLHMQNAPSLENIVKNAEESKFVARVASINKNTKKPLSVVFYSTGNKNVPIATVELNPNKPHAIDIKFGTLPLDNNETMSLLRLINKNIEIRRDLKQDAEFTIGFSGKSASMQAETLGDDIKAVFGSKSNVTIEKEPAEQPKAGRGRLLI